MADRSLLLSAASAVQRAWSRSASRTRRAHGALLAAALLALTVDNAVASRVVQVVAGDGFAVLLRDDGTVWTWGRNDGGQLGNGTTSNSSSPGRVLNIPKITSVSAGTAFAIALDVTGRLWAWGSSGYGALGSASHTNLTPSELSEPADVVEVSAAYDTVLARRSDGTVVGWGWNGAGQLGDGTNVNRSAPKAIGLPNRAVGIAAAYSSAYAVTADGAAYAWGSGALGTGTISAFALPVRLAGVSSVRTISGGDRIFAIRQDGSVWAWGQILKDGVWSPPSCFVGGATPFLGLVPTQVPDLSDIVTLSAPRYESSRALALNRGGAVSAIDTCKNLASVDAGPSTGRFVAVATGSLNTAYVLDEDGRLLATGNNQFGQLGLSDINAPTLPVALPGLDSVASVKGYLGGGGVVLKRDGTVWDFVFFSAGACLGGGLCTFFEPSMIQGFSAPIASIGSGVAVQTDGTLWEWVGQMARKRPGFLGVVDAQSNDLGVMVLTSGGEARGFICANDYYYPDCPSTPIDFGVADVVAIAAGSRHWLALRKDASVWALGTNEFGQLGTGDTFNGFTRTARRIDGLSGVKAIYGGDRFSLAVTQDGVSLAWGLLPAPRTPYDTSTTKNVKLRPEVVNELKNVKIAAAGSHVLAVDEQGRGFAWGQGAKVGERDRLIPSAVPWMDGLVEVAATFDASLALRADGQVLAWGDTWGGELGASSTIFITSWIPVKDPLGQAYSAGAVSVVEFLNASIDRGHHFVTADEQEALSLDFATTSSGWQRTGRDWRAWKTRDAAPKNAKPVYRFFSSRWNSHFYTLEESEKEMLVQKNPSQDLDLDWVLESVAEPAFFVIPAETTCPSLVVSPKANGVCATGQASAPLSCPAGTYPVYRAYNQRPLPNHRFTANWIDIYRSVRFLRYIYEGVAFCSPGSTQPGGDLHAFHTVPNAPTVAGNLQSEYWYTNAGPGDADGASIIAAMPTSVNWVLNCNAYNGARCPSDLTAAALRTGVPISKFPAGGVVMLTISGTAPSTAREVYYSSAIRPPAGAPDSNKGDNAAPATKVFVKSATTCSVTLSPNSVEVPSNASSTEVALDTPPGCAWRMSADNPWVSATPASGSGSASVKVIVDPNGSTQFRSATMTALADERSVQLGVRQSGLSPPEPCVSARMSRTADQVGTNEVTNFVSVETPSPTCTWDATSSVEWVTISASTRSGRGQVEYVIKANESPSQRSGVILISSGGKTLQVFSVFQDAEYTQSSGGGGDSGGDGAGSGGGAGG